MLCSDVKVSGSFHIIVIVIIITIIIIIVIIIINRFIIIIIYQLYHLWSIKILNQLASYVFFLSVTWQVVFFFCIYCLYLYIRLIDWLIVTRVSISGRFFHAFNGREEWISIWQWGQL